MNKKPFVMPPARVLFKTLSDLLEYYEMNHGHDCEHDGCPLCEAREVLGMESACQYSKDGEQ